MSVPEVLSSSPSVVPFILFQDGEYKLSDTFSDWLSSQEGPFAVASCAGKFRTGKSFLLNRLSGCRKGQGFGVGETVQACTRGIWARTEMLRLEEGEGSVPVLLLDTEGIDALDAECDHDVRIFSLAVLLSSVFLYNSMSHLDEAAVQTLSLMTKVASSLGKGHTPSLYWILRDFSLQLVDEGGSTISHSDYLESALDCIHSKCSTREAIKSVFPVRHLVTLPRPSSRESVRDLEKQGTTAKFDKFVSTFRNHLCGNAPPFCAAGRPIGGKEYVSLVRSVLSAVNEGGGIPKVEDAWTLMAKVQHGEEERRSLLSLLSLAEASCPHAEEDEVMYWVHRAVNEHPLSFLSPAPDEGGVRSRLKGEVLSWCRKAGRILTEEEVMERRMETAFTAFSASWVCKMGFSSVVETLLESRHVSSPVGKVLSKLVPLVDDSLLLIKNEGERVGKETVTLRNREVEIRMEDAERRVADAEGREAEARALLERERTVRPVMEEASTQTTPEDVLAEDVDKETHEGEEKEEDCAERRDVSPLTTFPSRLREETLSREVALLLARSERAEEEKESLRALYETNLSQIKEETASLLIDSGKEKEDALSRAKASEDRCVVMEGECDKWRGVLKDVQDKTVEMHRSTLEELRRRDAEQRVASDVQKERISDLVTQVDRAGQETRFLKRTVEEMTPLVEEAKRLKSVERKFEIHVAKEDASREALLSQLSKEREERDRLSRENAELNSRLAVSEASSRLESLRRNVYEAKK